MQQRVPESIDQTLVKAMPTLRAFAGSLCGDPARAEDLVQDTAVRALYNREKYRCGTNAEAWLTTILRNVYYSQWRKRRREVEDIDGIHSGRLTEEPSQQHHLELLDVANGMKHLPPNQREALMRVGVEGRSYEEAAEKGGVVPGTIKSRVSRARSRLEEWS